MRAYYESPEGITIFNGRCEDVLPTLPDASVDLVLTDPPYFRVKGDWWDRQWDSADGFLAWIDGLAAQWRRVLRPNGSLYVFASPEMAARVEVTIGERFDIVNSITWRKPPFSTKAEMFRKEDLRSFFPASERIIFAEQRRSALLSFDATGNDQSVPTYVFAPITDYLRSQRDQSGMTGEQLDAVCGWKGTAGHFFRRRGSGFRFPTLENYRALQHAAPGFFRRDYALLRQERDALRQDYAARRRPFAVTADVPYTDVWDYPTVPTYPGKHPCEKPLALLRHIITSSTRPGAVVLDCCMGSGNTLRAAKYLGRQGIGIDVERRWCDAAIGRLRQSALDFGAEVSA
jgi:site-specific DNA-methyltransferase (adenine-specific)